MKDVLNEMLGEKGINIETMLKEKGIDLEQYVNIEGHIGLTVQMVLDYIYLTPIFIQKKIARTFLKLDFNNGDVMDYIKYLAKGIVKGF